MLLIVVSFATIVCGIWSIHEPVWLFGMLAGILGTVMIARFLPS
jgi:hypothetical protein